MPDYFDKPPRYTHGKCERHKLIFRWSGSLRLRDARCPYCRQPLDRTAASLIKMGRGKRRGWRWAVDAPARAKPKPEET